MGTRNSKLARWQAEWVSARLTSFGHSVELVPITTSGDQSTGPLAQYGGVGVFTKEIQQALLQDRIDLAVHSLKDLPTEPIRGLSISAVPERANVNDAMVGTKLDDLPNGARIGTGSLRRKAQLLYLRPDLQVFDIRGNVDTRLAKLDGGQFDAIMLACAGLERLGLADRIAEQLAPDQMMPAVGQGALGIETRSNDDRAISAVSKLSDSRVFQSVTAERRLLNKLQAGCLAPIGATATVSDGALTLRAVVVSADGKARLETEVHGDSTDAIRLGENAADVLLAQGAADLISAARQS